MLSLSLNPQTVSPSDSTTYVYPKTIVNGTTIPAAEPETMDEWFEDYYSTFQPLGFSESGHFAWLSWR
jgi:hypothetical protein